MRRAVITLKAEVIAVFLSFLPHFCLSVFGQLCSHLCMYNRTLNGGGVLEAPFSSALFLALPLYHPQVFDRGGPDKVNSKLLGAVSDFVYLGRVAE